MSTILFRLQNTPYGEHIWVNIGSGGGLLSDEQFQHKEFEIYTFKITAPHGPMVEDNGDIADGKQSYGQLIETWLTDIDVSLGLEELAHNHYVAIISKLAKCRLTTDGEQMGIHNAHEYV